MDVDKMETAVPGTAVQSDQSYMNVSVILLCTAVFLLFLSWTRRYFQPSNTPPGPRGWPVLGNWPQITILKRKGLGIYEIFSRLGKKYGAATSISSLFGRRLVVVNGYHAVREVLNRHDLNARSSQGNTETQKGVPPIHQTGVLRSSGDLWKELRKFSLTTLRGLGVGKRSFEDQIAEESNYLLEEMSSTKGASYDPTVLLLNGVSNVICSVVFGKRSDYSEQKYQYFVQMIKQKLDNPMSKFIVQAFPFLATIPFGPAKRASKSITALRDYVKGLVEEHAETFDQDNLRDFTDAYLNEIRLKGQDSFQDKVFADNILAVLDDLFLAGSETTSTTLRWALLYMMEYPHIQTRVQEEIDSVVGRDRLPRLSDKVNLPYTEAVLHEVQRFASIVHMTGTRYITEDTTFQDYTITKGTFIVPNLYSTTRDPSIWQDPDDFKPERFLDDHRRINKPKELMVFGSGRRACLGEQLARMELYIFFTHLMHRFTFKKPNESDALDLKPVVTGPILAPKPYELCAIERE